jgi:hypothetical protein
MRLVFACVARKRKAMTQDKKFPGNRSPHAPVAPTISEMLGVTPILPGESEANYKAGLAAVIEELGAKTTLQVYIAEKIHDCLWWIRRYEDQKRLTVIAEMAKLVRGRLELQMTQDEVDLRERLVADNLSASAHQALGKVGHTIESARQHAYAVKQKAIIELDQQIALQVKILASFQGSYEVAFNRKLNVERLRMQNELIRRDLSALDMPTSRAIERNLPDAPDAPDDKPKAARRKPR